MKARLILLSLATVLLLSCNASDDEIMNYQFKNEAMKTETKTVTNHIAGVIQMNAAQFDCEIIEIGLTGRDTVRISVKGTPENLDALFAYANESTGTATV